MAEQVPSVGRVVHFVYGGTHLPAIITDPDFLVHEDEQPDWRGQAMTVFLVNAPPFTTVATHQNEIEPGTWLNGTWHWPEYVPAK